MSINFFRDLSGFSDFADVCNPDYYQVAPQDWSIVLTDVEDSTGAIQAGRYKDINMVGAACIAAVVNSCKGASVPYVFGGDGATALIPPDCVDVVKKALLSVKHTSQHMHNLSLRVGIVSMQEIIKRNSRLEVAKYVMPTGCVLAMFRGGGANLADDLVKRGGFSLQEKNDASPDLEGLSCRWQPIPAKRDTVLTLLVMVTNKENETSLYHDINHQIRCMLDDNSSPAHQGGLRYSWPGLAQLRQSQMVWRHGKMLKNLLGHIGIISLFNIMNRFNLKLGTFDVAEYRKDMLTNSDYRKFDDMLRMVVDCSNEQVAAIEAYLAKLHTQGDIVYGTHYSKTALMTCFVSSQDSAGHIHFIDGNDGGYALAAKQLKERLSDVAHASR